MGDSVIKIPEYHERPEHVADLWVLRKSRRKAICALWTHPLGGEIRANVSGELLRSEAKRDGLALFDLAAQWREQFVEKGWTV